MEILLNLIGPALVGLFLFFFKKDAKSTQKRMDLMENTIKELVETRVETRLTLSYMKETLNAFHKDMDELKELRKDQYKMEGKLEGILDQVFKIPELEKDLNSAHHLIRETKTKLQILEGK